MLSPSRFLPLLALLFACSAIPQTKSRPASPLDYFRRANSLMNLRLPGSKPFYMRVTFQAYPGMDFSQPGHSPILTGPGVYQETWVSPDQWRREVIFGSYHAVEIRAAGKRTFQASSSYEPSRVMMLLEALLDPIPRSILEPELEAHPPHWKLEHRLTGTIPWVRIGPYDFLPSGILVRSEANLLTSWDDDQTFADKIVPRHITVQGFGLESPMVAATVTISPLQPSGRTIVQVPGEPADPGSTLQPIDYESMDNGGGDAAHLQMPPFPPDHYPPGVRMEASWVVDKSGMSREPEITAIHDEGPPLSQQAKDVVRETASQMIDSIRKDRFHPGLIDGKPCQEFLRITMEPPRTE